MGGPVIDETAVWSGATARETRPWGYFQTLAEGPGFKTKMIGVQPGHTLSLQYHLQRTEHWVVVAGRAKVTLNAETFELTPNQTVHIPVGAHHRLANAASDLLLLIEVQCGPYLGEDDIVRIEDRYGRT